MTVTKCDCLARHRQWRRAGSTAMAGPITCWKGTASTLLHISKKMTYWEREEFVRFTRVSCWVNCLRLLVKLHCFIYKKNNESVWQVYESIWRYYESCSLSVWVSMTAGAAYRCLSTATILNSIISVNQSWHLKLVSSILIYVPKCNYIRNRNI